MAFSPTAPTALARGFLRYTLLLFLFLVCANTGFGQDKRSLTDTEFALCKARLERAHQGFYSLSYNDQYVRDVIMPAIRNERATVAPHFPARVSGQSSDALFKTWIETYPEEYEAYLQYLGKQHEKWRMAASGN